MKNTTVPAALFCKLLARAMVAVPSALLPLFLALGARAGAGDANSDGFRAVSVFLGEKKLRGAARGGASTHGERDLPGTWHAQVGQDRTIARLFEEQRGLYFIDLASNEPIYLSNSRTLERDFGWSGLCIDGSLELALKALARRRCQAVQAVVSNVTGDVVRFTTTQGAPEKESGYGGIVADGIKSEGKDRSGSIWKVQEHTTVSFADLLAHFDAPRTIDYLSLDLEGAEDAALLRFDYSRYAFRALTVERPSPGLRQTLRSNGYLYVGDHGCFGDQLWVHASMRAQAQRTLGLAIDGTIDSGHEHWFSNCSASEHTRRTFRPAEHVIQPKAKPKPKAGDGR